MNILNAGVTGRFIFTDPKTNKKIAEFKNHITDYGMQRLAGFSDHNAFAVAENFKHLHLGESDQPVSEFVTYKLIQPLVPGTDMTVVHGSVADVGITPSPTRTDYYRNASGNIVVKFINNWDVTFNRGVTIREIGVAHVGYNGSARQRSGYAGGGSTDDPARVNLQDNINQSLFSRATLAPEQPFSNGATTRVTYICEITLCSKVEWIENLLVDRATLPSPLDPLDAFPNSKFNTRQKPFYALNASGDPVDYFCSNGGNVPNSGVKTCPMLDSLTNPARGVWMLDVFLPSSGTPTYSTLTNTITSDVYDGTNLVPSPITSERIVKSDGTSNTLSHVKRYYPATSGYVVSHPSQNVWTTTIRFVIRSESLPTSSSATLWTLWRGYDANQQIPANYKGLNGITFALQNAYQPTANKQFGLDFSITWTR